MYFTRALDNTFTGGVTHFLAAFGTTTNTVSDHNENETAFSISLAAAAAPAVGTNTATVTAGGNDAAAGTSTAVDAAVIEAGSGLPDVKWYKAHGWLAAIAWGALLPSGVIFARRLRDLSPIWCASHSHLLCDICLAICWVLAVLRVAGSARLLRVCILLPASHMGGGSGSWSVITSLPVHS